MGEGECKLTDQEEVVELEVTGKLPEQLVHTVQPLQEHGTALVGVLT